MTENATGDGRCFVQPMLSIGATSGHISATNVGRAAFTLFDVCVMGYGVGGVATNIGELLHLKPTTIQGSANDLIEAMEAKTSSWR